MAPSPRDASPGLQERMNDVVEGVNKTIARLLPETDLPEYAFIGRSNVGKSSLINMLTNHKKLAKTSSFPGKTQLINHFLINNETDQHTIRVGVFRPVVMAGGKILR